MSTAGAVTTVDWVWEVELDPLSGFFEPILRIVSGADEAEVQGETMVLTAEEAGLRIRVRGVFQDEAGVFEVIRSAPAQVSGVPAPAI